MKLLKTVLSPSCGCGHNLLVSLITTLPLFSTHIIHILTQIKNREQVTVFLANPYTSLNKLETIVEAGSTTIQRNRLKCLARETEIAGNIKISVLGLRDFCYIF